MRLDAHRYRGMVFLAAVAIAIASLASPAQADHGRRYKGVFARPAPRAPHIVYTAPAPGYAYYDPYCGERFASLEAYGAHLGWARHPALAEVIEVDTGVSVGERVWSGGRGCERDDWHGDGERGDRDRR